MSDKCECANPDCQSINAKFVHKNTQKVYCKNCSSLMQYQANHYAFVNKSEKIDLFEQEINLNNPIGT